METGPQSILVYVGLDLIGDGLMKLPFVRALRTAYPHARITWLAGKGKSVYAGPLAPVLTGLIDEVIEDAAIGSHWRELLRRPLGGRQFDLIFDTQRRTLTTLILRRIRHRLFVSAAANHLFSDRRPSSGYVRPSSMIRQMLDLIELASGRPANTGAALNMGPALIAEAEALLPHGASYVGLAPGAGGKHKCWPLESFIELGLRQIAQGRVPVILLGPAEAEWVPLLRQALPDARFPLQDVAASSPLLTIALGQRLSAAVANDSGTGHMLAAAATPLVSLFGPTPPEKFAPEGAVIKVIRAQDFGGEAAMQAIPIDAVAAALDRLVDGMVPQRMRREMSHELCPE